MDTNYSDDVFFYPWKGDKYEDGINFGRENKEPLRLMVLGCDHYCSAGGHCQDRNIEQEDYICALTILGRLKDKELEENIKNYKIIFKKRNEDIIDELEQRRGKIERGEIRKWNKNKKHPDKVYVITLLWEQYKNLVSAEQVESTKKSLEQKLPWFKEGISLSLKKEYDEKHGNQDSIYLAIEKIFSIHSLWNCELEFQTNEIKKAIENLPKIIAFDVIEPPLSRKKCFMHGCAGLFVCKYMTKRAVFEYANEIIKDQKSFNYFIKTLLPLKPSFWNRLLFSEFFQRSMPNQEDDANAPLMTAAEKERATKAFINVITQANPHPDIIISWGKKDSPIGKGIYENKQVLAKHQVCITKESVVKGIEYTVLEYNKKKSLILWLNHPSYLKRNSGKEEEKAAIQKARGEYKEIVQEVFQNYESLK